MEGDQHTGPQAELLEKSHALVTAIDGAIAAKVIGQQQLRRRLLTALITGGHVLLEGVPGLAKTLSITALANAVHGTFKRIQFTPDLLPADIVGTEVYRPQLGNFEVRKGPVFANFLLADEINRAPAKVQSALLETMQERQVTIGEQTFALPSPFFVLATQNPIDQEGTYALPEAQVDRFLMKVRVVYPTVEEELDMLDAVTDASFTSAVEPVVELSDITTLQQAVAGIHVDKKINDYIVRLVWATRDPKAYGLNCGSLIELGASPRATISLFLCARAEALLSGTTYVVPQHIKEVARDVLRHRILPSYEAEAQGIGSDEIIDTILDGVAVP